MDQNSYSLHHETCDCTHVKNHKQPWAEQNAEKLSDRFSSPVLWQSRFQENLKIICSKICEFHPLNVTGSRGFKFFQFVFSNWLINQCVTDGNCFAPPDWYFSLEFRQNYYNLHVQKGWSFFCVHVGRYLYNHYFRSIFFVLICLPDQYATTTVFFGLEVCQKITKMGLS